MSVGRPSEFHRELKQLTGIEACQCRKARIQRVLTTEPVSEQWLQNYVNEKYAKVPRNVQVTPKKKGGVSNSM
jgi:hypothetical protein